MAEVFTQKEMQDMQQPHGTYSAMDAPTEFINQGSSSSTSGEIKIPTYTSTTSSTRENLLRALETQKTPSSGQTSGGFVEVNSGSSTTQIGKRYASYSIQKALTPSAGSSDTGGATSTKSTEMTENGGEQPTQTKTTTTIEQLSKEKTRVQGTLTAAPKRSIADELAIREKEAREKEASGKIGTFGGSTAYGVARMGATYARDIIGGLLGMKKTVEEVTKQSETPTIFQGTASTEQVMNEENIRKQSEEYRKNPVTQYAASASAAKESLNLLREDIGRQARRDPGSVLAGAAAEATIMSAPAIAGKAIQVFKPTQKLKALKTTEPEITKIQNIGVKTSGNYVALVEETRPIDKLLRKEPKLKEVPITFEAGGTLKNAEFDIIGTTRAGQEDIAFSKITGKATVTDTKTYGLVEKKVSEPYPTRTLEQVGTQKQRADFIINPAEIQQGKILIKSGEGVKKTVSSDILFKQNKKIQDVGKVRVVDDEIKYAARSQDEILNSMIETGTSRIQTITKGKNEVKRGLIESKRGVLTSDIDEKIMQFEPKVNIKSNTPLFIGEGDVSTGGKSVMQAMKSKVNQFSMDATALKSVGYETAKESIRGMLSTPEKKQGVNIGITAAIARQKESPEMFEKSSNPLINLRNPFSPKQPNRELSRELEKERQDSGVSIGQGQSDRSGIKQIQPQIPWHGNMGRQRDDADQKDKQIPALGTKQILGELTEPKDDVVVRVNVPPIADNLPNRRPPDIPILPISIPRFSQPRVSGPRLGRVGFTPEFAHKMGRVGNIGSIGKVFRTQTEAIKYAALESLKSKEIIGFKIKEKEASRFDITKSKVSEEDIPKLFRRERGGLIEKPSSLQPSRMSSFNFAKYMKKIDAYLPKKKKKKR